MGRIRYSRPKFFGTVQNSQFRGHPRVTWTDRIGR